MRLILFSVPRPACRARVRRLGGGAWRAGLLALLAGCAQVAPAPPAALPDLANWAADYTGAAAAGARVYAIDADASRVRVYVFRGGRAARLGHNHVLAAPRLAGYLLVPAAGMGAARFDVDLALDELELDRPEYRAGLGEDFAAAPSPADIASTRAHMLGVDSLQAAQYPRLHLRSMEIGGAAPKLAARVQVILHGRQHDYWVALDVDGLPGRLAVAGSFVLRQSDFGIRPYSILGGFVAVQDELVVEFRLVGALAGEHRANGAAAERQLNGN